MAQIIVRQLEDEVKARLRRRADRHGRSMEAEVRDILRAAAKNDGRPSGGLGSRIADRQKSGRPVDFRDTQIAGIALSRHATVATRNVRHFHGLKVSVVDPWKTGGR